MHLGNGALTPECAAIAGGLAVLGLGAAGVALRREPMTRQKLALAAGLGALVFAAQAINVPVLPGTSAHLVGGVLLAWVLGPGLGTLTMAVVLVLQALVLGDGGLAALGANILNMALLPGAMVAVVRKLQASESKWGALTSATAAATSVVLAAALIVGETALFRSPNELAGWQDFAARMIGTHLWVGLGEGVLTAVLVVALAWAAQPADRNTAQAGRAPSFRPAIACGLAALVLAAVAFPFGSALPDGYEAAAEGSGLASLLAEGSGAVAQAQAIVVDFASRVTMNEQFGVLAATMLTALAVAAVALTVSSRTRPAAARCSVPARSE